MPDSKLPPDLVAKTLLALRPYGHICLFSDNDALVKTFRFALPKAPALPMGNFRLLFYAPTALDWQNAYEGTDEYMVSSLKESVFQEVRAWEKEINSMSYAAASRLITRVANAEQDTVKIYHTLYSNDIKLRLNELKEALIRFRLGHGDKKEVLSKYVLLEAEMERYGDFSG